MYKALAYPDSFVTMPSGRVAVVLKHTEGEGVLCQYVDNGEEVEIVAKLLRSASDPYKADGTA